MFFRRLLNKTDIYVKKVTCNTVLLILNKNIVQIFFRFYTSNIVSKMFSPLPCGYKCKAFINAFYQQNIFLGH